jgi:hypothetical protein
MAMKMTPLGMLLLASTFVPAMFAAIDFMPTAEERVLEGIKFPQLIFHDDKGRKISYEQPRGWAYSGDSSRIRFTPPDVPQAVAEIAQVPLLKPEVFDDETITRLQNKAMGEVPRDSQGTVLLNAEKNPLMINARETFEVTVGYQLYGESYVQSVLFVNMEDTQLTCRFVGRKRDFAKLHQAFRGSLCSLQWL